MKQKYDYSHLRDRFIATHNIKDFQNAELLFPNLSILKPEEIIKS